MGRLFFTTEISPALGKHNVEPHVFGEPLHSDAELISTFRVQ